MVRLRPYKKCDAATIVGWLTNEAGFWKWCAGRYDHYPITAEDMNAFYNQFEQNPRHFQMTMLDGTEVKGHLIMQFLDEEMKDLKFGCIIVDSAVRGKGYGYRMLAQALDYAFGILKVDRVSLGVFENNPAAKRCYERLGLTATGKYEVYHLMGEDWNFHEMEISREKWTGGEPR